MATISASRRPCSRLNSPIPCSPIPSPRTPMHSLPLNQERSYSQKGTVGCSRSRTAGSACGVLEGLDLSPLPYYRYFSPSPPSLSAEEKSGLMPPSSFSFGPSSENDSRHEEGEGMYRMWEQQQQQRRHNESEVVVREERPSRVPSEWDGLPFSSSSGWATLPPSTALIDPTVGSEFVGILKKPADSAPLTSDTGAVSSSALTTGTGTTTPGEFLPTKYSTDFITSPTPALAPHASTATSVMASTSGVSGSHTSAGHHHSQHYDAPHGYGNTFRSSTVLLNNTNSSATSTSSGHHYNGYSIHSRNMESRLSLSPCPSPVDIGFGSMACGIAHPHHLTSTTANLRPLPPSSSHAPPPLHGNSSSSFSFPTRRTRSASARRLAKRRKEAQSHHHFYDDSFVEEFVSSAKEEMKKEEEEKEEEERQRRQQMKEEEEKRRTAARQRREKEEKEEEKESSVAALRKARAILLAAATAAMGSNGGKQHKSLTPPPTGGTVSSHKNGTAAGDGGSHLTSHSLSSCASFTSKSSELIGAELAKEGLYHSLSWRKARGKDSGVGGGGGSGGGTNGESEVQEVDRRDQVRRLWESLESDPHPAVQAALRELARLREVSRPPPPPPTSISSTTSRGGGTGGAGDGGEVFPASLPEKIDGGRRTTEGEMRIPSSSFSSTSTSTMMATLRETKTKISPNKKREGRGLGGRRRSISITRSSDEDDGMSSTTSRHHQRRPSLLRSHIQARKVRHEGAYKEEEELQRLVDHLLVQRLLGLSISPSRCLEEEEGRRSKKQPNYSVEGDEREETEGDSTPHRPPTTFAEKFPSSSSSSSSASSSLWAQRQQRGGGGVGNRRRGRELRSASLRIESHKPRGGRNGEEERVEREKEEEEEEGAVLVGGRRGRRQQRDDAFSLSNTNPSSRSSNNNNNHHHHHSNNSAPLYAMRYRGTSSRRRSSPAHGNELRTTSAGYHGGGGGGASHMMRRKGGPPSNLSPFASSSISPLRDASEVPDLSSDSISFEADTGVCSIERAGTTTGRGVAGKGGGERKKGRGTTTTLLAEEKEEDALLSELLPSSTPVLLPRRRPVQSAPRLPLSLPRGTGVGTAASAPLYLRPPLPLPCSSPSAKEDGGRPRRKGKGGRRRGALVPEKAEEEEEEEDCEGTNRDGFDGTCDLSSSSSSALPRRGGGTRLTRLGGEERKTGREGEGPSPPSLHQHHHSLFPPPPSSTSFSSWGSARSFSTSLARKGGRRGERSRSRTTSLSCVYAPPLPSCVSEEEEEGVLSSSSSAPSSRRCGPLRSSSRQRGTSASRMGEHGHGWAAAASPSTPPAVDPMAIFFDEAFPSPSKFDAMLQNAGGLSRTKRGGRRGFCTGGSATLSLPLTIARRV